MDRQSDLLRRIQAADFALYETVLYLDGHPKCRKALQYYEARQKEVETLRAEYERAYGPLSIYGNESCEEWKWVDLPWPWEKEAN